MAVGKTHDQKVASSNPSVGYLKEKNTLIYVATIALKIDEEHAIEWYKLILVQSCATARA